MTMQIQINKERNREYARSYYWRNREKCIDRSRSYRESNHDKYLTRLRRYRERNRDKVLELTKNWRENNKQHIKEYDALHNRKRILFGNKRVHLDYNPRNGVCQICNKSIISGEIKVTNMHHWVYITCLPWFGTEERCVGCHTKTLNRDKNGRFI